MIYMYIRWMPFSQDTKKAADLDLGVQDEGKQCQKQLTDWLDQPVRQPAL